VVPEPVCRSPNQRVVASLVRAMGIPSVGKYPAYDELASRTSVVVL
jgi:hypothetical protein